MSEEKEKKMAQEVYKEVTSELHQREKALLKGYFTNTLTELERKKSEKEKIEEEIRILNRDLEDLKEGKLDRIKERQEKSPVADHVSQVEINNFFQLTEVIKSEPFWYKGTYPIVWTVTAGDTIPCNQEASYYQTKTLYF
jgi:hypothetical protein